MSHRLEVRGLSVRIGGRALVDGLDFEVGAGEVLGLVGRSGSGKSLSALAVLGLAPPGAEVSGSVRLEGRDLLGLPQAALCAVRGRGVGMVFQDPATALDPVMPIGEQVAEALRAHRLASHAEARRLALDMLGRVGLDPTVVSPERRPHQLSGGQRQRVAIAAAAVLRPKVLLADEPTTALDVIAQAEVAALLKRLAREEAMALVLISHDLALVAGLADRIVLMQAGKRIVEGAPATLLASPEPAVRALRDAVAPPPLRSAPKMYATGAPLLEASGLRRLYAGSRGEPGRGLHDASLVLHPGERLAVVGETGSGKSTLARLLLGLDRPDAGEVRLGGEAFAPASPARQRRLRRRIQPVFQDPATSFDPRWTVERLVAEPLALLDPPLLAASARERVAEALAEVGLAAEDGARLASSFSGGQRQRIALARALAVGPDILVLDEATSALDVVARAEMLALLARLEVACVIVTHDLAVVRAAADRVMVLQAGRVVEQGTVEAVFTAPQHPYTRALIAATPDLERTLAALRTGQVEAARPLS